MKSDLRLTVHYGLTIFLSAFLLFQVQPLVGKMILPWFGGSASVWTACMLFFQMVLLLGYLYSHWLVRFLSPYRQSLLHAGLILLALLSLPIATRAGWKPTGAEDPTLRILGLLTVSIGLPYFVLSTTGPLLQAWFARERPGLVPYRLFALSNFGSMLALLAYPVAVEPFFPTHWQSLSWSALFGCFAFASLLLAWQGRNGKPVVPTHHEEGPAPQGKDFALWTALAACPSILLVADTSFLTTNIAPIPLLWVAPLALYLLSFILSFERRGWYRRWFYLPLFIAGLCALAYVPTLGVDYFSFGVAMAINLGAFFAACMVCHGELARLQPHPSHLTAYYLMLAVGGATGGVFVGVVAPYWLNSNYDFSIGILLTLVVAAAAVISSTRFVHRGLRAASIALAVGLFVALSWIRIEDHIDDTGEAEVTVRNFYGTLQVSNDTAKGYRTLYHGQITHGQQLTAMDKLDQPTTYFSARSGVGRALLTKAAAAKGGPLRVGVIGLGAGTLLSYGRKGDYFRVYEINPLVVDIAQRSFSFMSRTRAQTDVVLGDARLQLEREPSQNFDVLVVDAFSGDAVPVHLLTLEAFAEYFRHLKPDGVLAVHITNAFLDLKPVVKAAADHFNKEVRLVGIGDEPDRLVLYSHWALISGERSLFLNPDFSDAVPLSPRFDYRPWTDNYSSIFSILL